MTAKPKEVELVGGQGSPGVVRLGDTVHRPPAQNAKFARALLRYLKSVGFEGAPRLLGIDEQGREILSFVRGNVVHEPATPLSEQRLRSAGTLIRAFHDATAGCPLADKSEVVCHGELGPHNMVFVGDEAIGLIDWETAAPGSRLQDLDRAAWFFAQIGDGGGELSVQLERVRLLCEGYGWADPREVTASLKRAARAARSGS